MTPGPPARGLLDTDVVVDYRDGWPGPVQFFTAVRAVRLPEFSQITALALFPRCQDQRDVDNLRLFFSISTVHGITAKIAQRAFQVLDGLPPPCGLTADDAIVAATALVHKLPLYTLDPGRFAAVPGLTALRPY